MHKFVRVMGLTLLLWGGIHLCSGAAQAAYTYEDITAAGGDVARFRKIFEDKETPREVRLYALRQVTAYGGRARLEDYVDTAFMEEDIAYRGEILAGMAFAKSDKWQDAKHYPMALEAAFKTGQTANLYYIQRMHVVAIIRAGKGQEALSEAKRLLSFAPIQETWLSDAVQVIGTAVRASALSGGKSIKEALAEQNAYLEAVKKNDVSQTSYVHAAFPSPHPLALVAEEAVKMDARVDALLFNGKYEAAEQLAQGQVGSAMTEPELQVAILLLGRVRNGKTGLPTAVNAVMGE